MDKFKVFKTQIDMPPNVLQYFELKEVQVDSKSKVWHFHIDVKSSVDVHHLMTFESYLKVYFKTSVISKVTVSFHQKADFDTPMLEKYIQTIVHEYQKLKPSAGALKHFNFNIDHDVIMFHVDEDSAYIKQHFKQIEKMLHTYGLFFTLDLSVNKEIPKATAVIENEKKQLDVIHDKQIRLNIKIFCIESLTNLTNCSPTWADPMASFVRTWLFQLAFAAFGYLFCRTCGNWPVFDADTASKSRKTHNVA